MSNRLPGHVLFANIKEGMMKREDLTIHQRKLVTQFLRYESNYTVNKIAEFLQIHPATVWRYTKELTKYAGQVYAFEDTEKYARQMMGEMRELKERARAKNDNWLELAIIRDRTKLLGRMGMINFKMDAPVLVGVPTLNENPARKALNNLTPEQREILAKSFEAAGLLKPEPVRQLSGPKPEQGQ